MNSRATGQHGQDSRESSNNQCCKTRGHGHKCINYGDAVKTKVVTWASLGLLAVLSLAEAGPRAGVFVRAGGAWCPPVRAICPRVPISPPVVCRSWPVYYYPSYSAWASSPVISSASFSNVSPAFSDGETGIYRVSAPVISGPTVIDSPETTFRWRH